MANTSTRTITQPHQSLAGQRTRFAAVYSLLEEAVANGVFPGCSFGVLAATDAGLEVIALDAVGRQTYAEHSPAITPATMYDLASLTKVVATTAMAMILYDCGKLALDQPVHSILPEFGASAERGRVTLRHLLAHASGLPGYVRLFESASTAERLLEACFKLPLEHDPGEHAEYSDIGFILLGRALEVLAGESIDSFCQREVFTRCGMDQSLFVPPSRMKADIPPTEDDTVFRHRMIQGEVQDENCSVLGGISGHAGLFGNALDLLRFATGVLRSAAHGSADAGAGEAKTEEASTGDELFRPETVRLFATRADMPLGSARALGWDTPSSSPEGPSSSGSLFTQYSIGHLGYAGTSLWIDLEDRLAIVLLTNRTWPSRGNQKIRKLRPAFHDAVRTDLVMASNNVR